ncbi:DUF1800 domain-containing protein [Undibacterium danionis]|uniref:DUF1800 family protein n=1 Tax=Undibacterium danionis TaxID=1812100 RepID=A0ABV6IH93_9BURK
MMTNTINFNPTTSAISAGVLLSLSACGGNSSITDNGDKQAASNNPNNATMAGAPANAPLVAISETEAARFLAQAGLEITRAQIVKVQNLGYSAWLDEQMAMPPSMSRWDWLVSKGMNDISLRNSQAGFDACAWRKLINSPDTLRQRVSLALSEILVISINGLVNGGGWKAFAAAHYLDLLEANCFGNYRDLLEKVSTSTAMSLYLTFRGNTKFNPTTGALPDENYARELMQLFSIGLLQLHQDGSVVLQNGIPSETYTLDDITGLARVFTGWDFDLSSSNLSTPDYHRRPLKQIPAKHESGASSFLGQTIPAGLSGEAALSMSLDIIFAHPNVAPFISRQLIQRLVTSNPSPAYVARVSAVFSANSAGIKGDLKAVIKAILLDEEARTPANLSKTDFGKVREPMIRFLNWARSFNANSASDTWRIGDTSDAGTKLGQSPLRSPSVFNFFRPGYVPPNSAIANANLVAPEMQIVSESSVVGYINFMQSAVSGARNVGDLRADYSALLSLADKPQALVAELNLLLAANQIDSNNTNSIVNAIASMPIKNERDRNQRIYAALTLVLAAPEFIVLK